MAQLGRALRSGRRGRVFESRHSDIRKRAESLGISRGSALFYTFKTQNLIPLSKKSLIPYFKIKIPELLLYLEALSSEGGRLEDCLIPERFSLDSPPAICDWSELINLARRTASSP